MEFPVADPAIGVATGIDECYASRATDIPHKTVGGESGLAALVAMTAARNRHPWGDTAAAAPDECDVAELTTSGTVDRYVTVGIVATRGTTTAARP